MTREEAIVCLKGIKNYGRDTFTKKTQTDWQDCLDMAIEVLEHFDRPVAHWIDNSDGGRVVHPFWNRYICSNCGRHSDLENYCCNCGSEMEDE